MPTQVCRVRQSLPLAVWLGALAMGMTSAGALAQAAGQAAEPTKGVVWLETSGWDEILVSPKDARLKAAMKMLPERLAEIPGELPEEARRELPAGVFDLAAALISSPFRAALAYDPENPSGGFFGGGLIVSFLNADKAGAEKTAGYVQSLVGLSPFKPKPSKAIAGMSDILLPFGMVRTGPRQTSRGPGGWAYELHVGTLPEPDALLNGIDEAKEAGVKPYLRARFDAAPLEPLLEFVEVMAGEEPEAAEMIEAVKETGVVGPNGVKATHVSGYAEDRAVKVTRVKGLSAHAAKLGLSDKPVPASAMKVIPSDAHWGTIGSFETGYFRQQIDTAMQNPEAQEALAQIKAHTGVDPVEDLLGSIGGCGAVYLADSTGGGGLMSMVFAVGVKDQAKLTAAMKKLSTHVNEFLSSPETARGYAMVRTWTDESAPGCEMHSVSFAGLPVPIEVTWSIAGDWLVAGLTPQAALMAARQASGKGDGGIVSNPRIAAAMPKGEFISFSFNDPAKTLREGYPLASMAGSAVANLVRSRAGGVGGKGAAREVGLVVPPLADLLAGARASVSWTAWEGGDLVQRSEGDRSQIVQMAMKAGQFMPFAPVLSLGGAGAALGAMQDQMKGLNAPTMGGGPDDEDEVEEEEGMEGE
ncbi:MAG: hypothetical protein JNK35_01235 [Phycisphaerae bacterium]|nr:hypothetical protein [Phycisphaerae bacterium]